VPDSILPTAKNPPQEKSFSVSYLQGVGWVEQLHRKVTGGFRSTWGAGLYAAVRSVIGTAARRGVGAYQAIRTTLEGQSVSLRVASRYGPKLSQCTIRL